MDVSHYNFILKFSRQGVLHREETKNNSSLLKQFLTQGYAQKVRQKRQVFYQLTPKAVPLLELCRQELLARAQMMRLLKPRSKFYEALLTDLRFMDEKHPEAEKFKFLGDWQLNTTPNKYQLELAQVNYFEELAS